jgi:hypothetical protein
MPIANERQAGLSFLYLQRSQPDGLEVSDGTCRFHTERFELLDDVCLCRALTGAAGVTALEPVVRKHRHRVPPCLAIEVLRGLGCAGEQ